MALRSVWDWLKEVGVVNRNVQNAVREPKHTRPVYVTTIPVNLDKCPRELKVFARTNYQFQCVRTCVMYITYV